MKPTLRWPDKKSGRHGDRNVQREYHRAYREQNRERVNALARKWARKNKSTRTAAHAIRRSATPRAPVHEVTALVQSADGYCIYCGLKADKLQIDHITPVSKGGTGDLDNLMPVCRQCNQGKSAKEFADWLFETHGVTGLARAIVFMEQRRIIPELMPPFENGITVGY